MNSSPGGTLKYGGGDWNGIMARARAKPAQQPVGPGRWGFRIYHIFDRPTPRGRRYEIRTPEKELVAICRTRRNADALSFFADDTETTELVRFLPKSVRLYSAAYEVVDPASGKTIAEFRKKTYRPLGRSEWFIVNSEGDPLGMVMESAPGPSILSRFIPSATRPKTFEMHWGQSVGGRISHKRVLLGLDHTQVDLSLDQRDEIDRRLALGVAVLVRAHEHGGSDRKAAPVKG